MDTVNNVSNFWCVWVLKVVNLVKFLLLWPFLACYQLDFSRALPTRQACMSAVKAKRANPLCDTLLGACMDIVHWTTRRTSYCCDGYVAMLCLWPSCWPTVTFQIDLKAETPVVPLHLRDQQAVVGGEDEGPGAGLVKRRDDCKQVRPNHFRRTNISGFHREWNVVNP